MAGGGGASLEETPTWAVAVVCFVLITLSLLIEGGLHSLAEYFTRKRRKSLIQALYKIKSELMLLGFISLFLTISQKPIATICIPKSLGQDFLPCQDKTLPSDVVEEASCVKKGKVSLISKEGVNQLQYLIFALAVFHILTTVLTFGLGMAKMKRWKFWEEETRTLEYQFTNDPRRFRLTHQTTFGRRHLKSWSDYPLLLWPACFLRQFYGSVSKTDYFTLRHGFITAHFAEDRNFNFQKFIKRSLEEDFLVIVGVSLWVWTLAVLFIFFNAHEFHNSLWLPFFPLVMLLVVGTQLQVIITKMCLDSHGKDTVVRGTVLVRPSDDYFWFHRPHFLLHIMHFILFQNSFQLAFFTWTWYKFGFRSCFHRTTADIVIRIVLGVIVQLLSSYVTLPLYALVTQMGSSMKKAVFTKSVINGLNKWRTTAKRNLAARNGISSYPSLDTSLRTSPSLTADTSISDGQEIEMTDLDQPSPVAEHEAMEIIEEEKIEHRPGKEHYNGEISFGWLKEEEKKS